MSDQPEQKFHLKYDSMTAVFADHVVLNGINGAFILDFASSMVNDPSTGRSTIPVHTRIAMSHQGAAQLSQLLANAFAAGARNEAATTATRDATEATTGAGDGGS
jgi:hypothetical protein